MFKQHSLIAISVAAWLLLAATAQALTIKPYTAVDFAATQSTGAAVALHMHADWCPTCKAQAKVLGTLTKDPALDKVTLFVADYDKEKELRLRYRIQRQSTILVFKGTTEVLRDSGAVLPETIKEVLSSAL